MKKRQLTEEQIDQLEPSKQRVMRQLDDLGIMDEHERDCFYKGVLFAKGYLKEDFDHLTALIENKNAYIQTIIGSNNENNNSHTGKDGYC